MKKSIILTIYAVVALILIIAILGYIKMNRVVGPGIDPGLRPEPAAPWICQKYNGTWITKYNECEYISQEICEKHLSGTFYECAPGCRHVEDAEDVCKMPCVDVCVIE